MKLSDREMLSGIRNRENLAFNYLDYKVKAAIRLMVIEKGGNRKDAEDVYSDGIEILIQKVDNPDYNPTCSMPTLLYAICVNKWKQILDRKAIHHNYQLRHNECADSFDFSENQDNEMYRRILWDCLEKLDRSCRQIIKACLKETPLKELAQMLDYTYGHLRKKKCICHGYLMEMIRNHPDMVFIREKEGLRVNL